LSETIPAARETWLDSTFRGVLDPDEQQTLLKATLKTTGFRRAVAVFIANLKTGEGGFIPELRVHKLVNTEIWSLTWANDGRALFRFGAEITPDQTHIIREAIGTNEETYGRVK
jgi:hypothetical protein